MAITNFIPEVWAAQLLSSLKKSLVYGSPAVVNRNYEGSISAKGDTVNITTVVQPTIAPYTKDVTTVTPATLTDGAEVLNIDQAQYFAFEIDDIDMRQAENGGALLAEAASEAGYGLADVADQYIAGIIDAGVDAGNAIAATQINTASLAVTGIIDLKVLLDESNAPNQGRYVVVPPWYHALLLQDDRFVRVDASGSSEGLRNGIVGRAFGFDVLLSNNAPTADAGDDSEILAGVPGATTFAEQIAKVEAFRPESAFSDALKGLHLYGAANIRSTAVAKLTASQSAV